MYVLGEPVNTKMALIQISRLGVRRLGNCRFRSVQKCGVGFGKFLFAGRNACFEQLDSFSQKFCGRLFFANPKPTFR